MECFVCRCESVFRFLALLTLVPHSASSLSRLCLLACYFFLSPWLGSWCVCVWDSFFFLAYFYFILLYEHLIICVCIVVNILWRSQHSMFYLYKYVNRYFFFLFRHSLILWDWIVWCVQMCAILYTIYINIFHIFILFEKNLDVLFIFSISRVFFSFLPKS